MMSGLTNYLSAKWIKDNPAKVFLILSVVIIFSYILILNIYYPVYLDDWYYTFSLVDGERINSFWGVIQSQYVHYFEWGGRAVLHTIAQLLLWFGKPWSDILNALAYTSFVLILYSIVNKGNKTNPFVFIFINIFIWFSLPSLSQNIIWTTGSANYLWGGLLIFWFICYYVSYYINQDRKDNINTIAGIFILGVLAGWTNENVGVSLIFFLFGLIALMKYQKKYIPKWIFAGLIGSVIGCAVMLLSPGNMVRSANDLWVAHQRKETDISFYFYRFITVSRLALHFILIPCGIYLCLLIIYWFKGNQYKKKEKLLLSLLFFFTAAVATCVMSGSPMFPERAWFGILIFLLVAIMILYANLDFAFRPLRIINSIIFAFTVIVYIVSLNMNYIELLKFKEVSDRREKQILTDKAKGEKDIVITDVFFQQKQSPLVVLDLQDWLMIDPGWNTRIGKYYGVNTIVFKSVDQNHP